MSLQTSGVPHLHPNSCKRIRNKQTVRIAVPLAEEVAGCVRGLGGERGDHEDVGKRL
jgi:hypothetical protein